MQSIYGFRKANVSLFIRARRDGIDQIRMQPIDLTANFRSDQQIVNWVNSSFSRIFPEQDNLVQGQVAFKKAQPTRSPSDWHIQLNGYASELIEAESIAGDILEKTRQGETSLAILVRGRSHLREILPALRARDIQWQAQNIDHLGGRMPVMDIHSLTRALCCPADRIAWLSILRAPWVGLSMADLLALTRWQSDEAINNSIHNPMDSLGDSPGDNLDDNLTDAPPTIWTCLAHYQHNSALSAEAKYSCGRLKTVFDIAFDRIARGAQNLRSVVEQLWLDLNADQGLLEARDLEDVNDYLDLLERMESGGAIADWMRFEQKLGELYSRPALANGAVQIMTIHSAKGLEFDHVFLPGLHRLPGGSNEAPLLLWWQREFENGKEAYLLSAKPAASSNKVQDLYAYLKAEENERQRQETARLLYVATTRARKSLFISGKLNWDEEKEKIRDPDSRTMLSILWGLYKEDFSRTFDPAQAEQSATDSEALSILTGIRRLPPERPFPVVPEKQELSQNPQFTVQTYRSNYMARLCGDLIHHSLMRIVREQISQPSAKLFATDWHNGLEGRGLDIGQKQTAKNRLDAMLNVILEHNTGRWLLDWNHEQSAAELEMDYLNDYGGIQRAIIDRTFVENGIRWIIDYKSSSPAENQSLEDFLQHEILTYRPQLERYAALFDEPVKIMLYFPAIPAAADVNSVSEL